MSTDDDTRQRDRRVDVVQIAAGALAAVTAAVIGSRLGVNGTIIGAALGSIVGGIGSAAYAEFIGRTATRVRTVVVGSATEPPTERTSTIEATAAQRPAHPPTGVVPAPSRQWQPPALPPSRRRSLSWRGVALAVAAAFVVALAAVTGFELLTGRTLSTFTGGGSQSGTSVVDFVDPPAEVVPTAELPSPDPTSTLTSTPSPSLTPTATPSATESATPTASSAPATSSSTPSAPATESTSPPTRR